MRVDFNAEHGYTFPRKALVTSNAAHAYTVIADTDTDNGAIIKIGDLHHFERGGTFYKPADATEITATIIGQIDEDYVVYIEDPKDNCVIRSDTAIVDAPFSSIANRRNVYNGAGELMSAEQLSKGDEIVLSKECFDGTPSVGAAITAITDGKLTI